MFEETKNERMQVMKKIIALLLTIITLLSLAACGGNSAAPETTVPETTAAQDTTAPASGSVEAPSEAPVVTARPLYSEILDSYFDALLQGLEPTDYMDRGLNYLPGIVKDLNEVGYVMDDLDGDGTSELMIGSVSDGLIYAMYTVKDGVETQIIDAGERNTFQLTSDGLFLNRGSNGAASYGYNLYSFANGQLTFQDGIVFDAGRDEQNPWFYTKSEAWDQDKLEPLETAAAETMEQDLIDSVVSVSFIPFSQYTA